MHASKSSVGRARLAVAILGSLVLHGALFHGLQGSSSLRQRAQTNPTSQDTALHVELLPPIQASMVESSLAALPQKAVIPEAHTVQDNQPEALTKKSQTAPGHAAAAIAWTPQDAKVEEFPDLPYPPDTVNISASMDIEVSLDENAKPLGVKVLRESPKGMFSEWAWELGMKGRYKPRITENGPVASTLLVRLSITPGLPIEVR